jgi:hypothetical protein
MNSSVQTREWYERSTRQSEYTLLLASNILPYKHSGRISSTRDPILVAHDAAPMAVNSGTPGSDFCCRILQYQRPQRLLLTSETTEGTMT